MDLLNNWFHGQLPILTLQSLDYLNRPSVATSQPEQKYTLKMKTFTSLIPQQDLTPIKNPTPSILQTQYPFWFGGSAASMAAIITHPLDLGE